MYPNLLSAIEKHPDIKEFLASFPFAEQTKDTYARSLLQLVECPYANWSASDLVQFVTRPEWGTAQRYSVLCACRKFILWKFGQSHPALAARVKNAKAKRQRWLPKEVALELLASFDTYTITGARDLAIAALAMDTGLRCSELCHLKLADVDLNTCKLGVVIKGGSWGEGIFSEETAQYIAKWIFYRASRASPGVETLFISLQHQRKGLSLTREGLQGMFKRWGERIGIRLSPHDMRRTFATLATMNGAPSRVVQLAGRWKHIAMVEHYTQGVDAAAIAAYLPVSRLGEASDTGRQA